MQSTITDDMSVVGDINNVLAAKIGQQRYRIWFKDSTRMSLVDGYLKVGVPNLFIASWIEGHFSSEISQAVLEATGTKRNLMFVIDPELAGGQGRRQLDSQAERVTKAQNRTTRHWTSTKQNRVAKKLKLSFNTFVVGKSNELAYNAAKAVAEEKQSPFNPLFVHGGYGVGKTHLLQGICNAVCEHRPGTNWLYLSAEDFANQFILALKTRKLEAFRSRMRKTDLLAIDDIHFLANKTSTQQEFLHTFNSIDLAGKQVILVSDAHPKMIGQLSEKLVNRFISGMVVKIDNPDFQTRCRICKQYARTTKHHITESVIQYVAENLRTNVRELEGAILKLVAFASLQNKKINLHMAKQVLSEHLARTDIILQTSDIESVVATFFGITPAELHSSKKNRTITLARHFSMYLARKHTRMSSSEIGRCMGNKNHATVLLACRNIEDKIKCNTQLQWHGPNGNKVSKARTVLSHLLDCIVG